VTREERLFLLVERTGLPGGRPARSDPRSLPVPWEPNRHRPKHTLCVHCCTHCAALYRLYMLYARIDSKTCVGIDLRHFAMDRILVCIVISRADTPLRSTIPLMAHGFTNTYRVAASPRHPQATKAAVRYLASSSLA
jgi:hypothetical protein